MNRLRTLALASAVALVARASHASQDYPSVIADKLMVPAPDCTLCHRDNNGGTGTVVTQFGLSMMAFGAMGKNPASLEQALDADSASGCDSDGDGLPDIPELMAGTDPSDGPGGTCGAPGPKHGCGATIGRRETGRQFGASLTLFAAALLAYGARRRQGKQLPLPQNSFKH
jgi:hypothetical protein